MSRTYDEKDSRCGRCCQTLVPKSDRISDCEYKGAQQVRWAIRRPRPKGGFQWATWEDDALAWSNFMVESIPFTAEAAEAVLASEADSRPERVPVDRAFLDEVFRLKKQGEIVDGVSLVILDPDDLTGSVRKMTEALNEAFGVVISSKH